eukprot:ANDGO_04892.mRNA.1 Pre-mRNA-splicing factor cwc24
MFRKRSTAVRTSAIAVERDEPTGKESSDGDGGDVAEVPAKAAKLSKLQVQLEPHNGADKRTEGTETEKEPVVIGSKRGTIRTSIRMDYQPDMCKDFKDTGYCPWGDTCKFAHIREDYKQGWQLDRDWGDSSDRRPSQEQEQKGNEGSRLNRHHGTMNRVGVDVRMFKPASASASALGGRSVAGSYNNDDDVVVPAACPICKEVFATSTKAMVVTECKHYFCEACALQRSRTTLKCAVCNRDTRGIFNTAKNPQRSTSVVNGP